MTTRTQLSFFALLLVLGGMFLIRRIWQMHPLKQNHAQVKTALERVTGREGWLLSGVEILSVDANAVTLLYHDRRRGRDPASCYVLNLSNTSLTPCDANR